jgi:uncharacterized membrane protein YhaH (DUF805 family)
LGVLVNFPTAVAACFKKYAKFSGVAARSEYWWFYLFTVIVSIILDIIGISVLKNLWALAILIPGLAVAVRRLHDTNRSAWWLLTSLILPWFIVLLCLPGFTMGNRYVLDGGMSARAPSITEAEVTNSSSKCPSCGKMRLPGQNYCMGCGTKFAD